MKTISDLSAHIEKTHRLIEDTLKDLLAEKNIPYAHLYEAARYSLLSGGKRLRPLLTLATASVFGVAEATALLPACALEMIHTYSLIHDDLPCMDDDDFRRGKPSLHKAFNENLAVLTGDFLLTYAFEVLTRPHQLSPEQKVSLIQILSQNAGAKGMIGGQVMDIEAEGKRIDADYLKSIHHYKTGSLIAASILFGGIVGHANSTEMQALNTFGLELGIAFQMIDDVLDVTTNKNSDAKNDKTTYVTLLGIEKTQYLAKQHHENALNQLNNVDRDTSLLKELADLFILRDK